MQDNLIANRQIRVFISSTFDDMQDERKYLMTYTFPKLRELASKRDVMLTEVDLRWGVTAEESKSGKVIDICLKEIENSIPFFIGIIGNRYGWVPKEAELREGVTDRFPPVKDFLAEHLSVTEMEMQFGVLKRPEDMHAFFYIKEQETKSDNADMLSKLKDAVKKSRYPSSLYSSAKDLARQVEDAFTNLLDQLFPEGNLNEHQKEKLIQQSFISKLSSTYIKDESVFKQLDTFVSNPSSQYFVVTGESGLGKSSLLANWSKEKQQNGELIVIPYFSSNGGKPHYAQILRYISLEICEKLGIDSPHETNNEQIQKLFEKLASKKDKVVIVLDAINQIADIDQSKMLNWLPIPPANVKYIFSTLEEDQTMQVFLNRSYPILHLQHLDRKQRTELVQNYLKNSFGKSLTEKQLSKILDDEQCRNTLVLKTLLEELICCGDFNTLDDKIESYLHSSSVTEFYNKVIARFEKDYGQELVRRILCLIAVSRNGVSEDEILRIIGVRRLEWSDFFCGFAVHLNNQSGRLVFTHSYITSTVWNRYLKGNLKFELECRKVLAEEQRNVRSINSMQEVPYQYDHIGDMDKLYDYIRDFEYLVYCMDYNEVEIATYWRHIFAGTDGRYSLDKYLELNLEPTDQSIMLQKLIRLSIVLSFYKEQKKYAQRLVELFNKHPEVITPIAYSCISSGIGRPESIEYAKKAIEICQRSGDKAGEIEAHRILGSAYYDAMVNEMDDDYGRKAYDEWAKGLELSRELYGEFHPLIMHAYEDMCLVCDDDPDKALELANKALEMATNLYGKDHPLTGRPFHYVGVIYHERKEWENALKYFQQAGRIWTPAYGINHQIMISNYGNQGQALMKLGRYDEAIKCYQTGMDIVRVLYDEKGIDDVKININLARIYDALGQYEKAIEAWNEAESALQLESVKRQKIRINLSHACSAIRADVMTKMSNQ